MAYLFSISLGPAQEFIATARRTRDLWFSSWLLSELSKAAARAVGKNKLIFPFVNHDEDLKPGSEFNVVNKILAIVDDNPQKIGSSVKAAVRIRLNEIKSEAFRALPDGSCDLVRADAQIEALPDLYWAAVPFNGDYSQARHQVEALLAARKNTRDFGSTDKWRGNVPKSALDGLRESVIRKRPRQLISLGLKEKEELCGVGLLKRIGSPVNLKEGEAFASVPHIAAWPLIQSFDEKHRNALNDYVVFLKAKGICKTALYCPRWPRSDFFPYDGHILFEEQLKEYFDEITQQPELDQAREKLRCLRNKIGPAPSSYYAILHGDGDRMGEAIDARKNVVEHQRLSQALSLFAGEAREIVKKYKGSMIYSGGDDVLALVPLSTVVQCARQLSDTFKNKLSEFKNAKEQSPTFSIGISISHQMDPLEDALKLARAAEKEAKQFDREVKNSLCIKVSKRSGAVTTVKGRWDSRIDERLLSFAGFHEHDELPDGVAYELRRLADDLRHFEPKIKVDAYKKEVTRILCRKRSRRGADEVNAEIQKELSEKLPMDSEKICGAVRSLADELIVARLFVNKFGQKGERE